MISALSMYESKEETFVRVGIAIFGWDGGCGVWEL